MAGEARTAIRIFVELSRVPRPTEVPKSEVSKASQVLARLLHRNYSLFTSKDVAQLVSGCGRLAHKNIALLEAAAKHTMSRLQSYKPFALCNIVSAFARITHHHKQLFQLVADHVADPVRVSKLEDTDVANLVYAYGCVFHRPGKILETCAHHLKEKSTELSGANIAIILNAYARLDECDPELFDRLERQIMLVHPQNYEVRHLSVLLNAYAKCRIRKSRLTALLGQYLTSHVNQLDGHNMCNVVNAFAQLEYYNHPLFVLIKFRLAREDLAAYKLFELTNVAYGLAKMGVGGMRIDRKSVV